MNEKIGPKWLAQQVFIKVYIKVYKSLLEKIFI